MLDEFTLKLTKRMSITIRNLSKNTKLNEEFNLVREFFYHEYYVKEILISIGEVKTLLEQLKISIIQISNFRNTNKNNENKITRFDWYIYNIENYYFRFTGILDRVLKLALLILEIKIKNEDIYPSRFIKDKNGKSGQHSNKIIEKNPELFHELVKFQEFINSKRDLRDKIVHKERYYHNSLQDIEMFDLVIKIESDVPPQIKYYYKNIFDRKISEKKTELQSDLYKLKSCINEIFKVLDLEFDKKYKDQILKHFKNQKLDLNSNLIDYKLFGLTEEEIKVVEGDSAT